MTEHHTRRRRLSRRALRALAWAAGGLAFASPFAALTISPRPAAAEVTERPRRVIVVRKITRRVIVHAAPETPAVRYVYVDGGSSGSTGSSTGPSASGGTAVAAPSAPTSTGGS